MQLLVGTCQSPLCLMSTTTVTKFREILHSYGKKKMKTMGGLEGKDMQVDLETVLGKTIVVLLSLFSSEFSCEE